MYGNYVVIAESNRGEQMQAFKKKQGKSVLREPSRLQKGFILICFWTDHSDNKIKIQKFRASRRKNDKDIQRKQEG